MVMAKFAGQILSEVGKLAHGGAHPDPRLRIVPSCGALTTFRRKMDDSDSDR